MFAGPNYITRTIEVLLHAIYEAYFYTASISTVSLHGSTRLKQSVQMRGYIRD